MSRWEESVKRTGVPYHLVELPEHPIWFVNAQRKPRFIVNCIEQFGDILWLDIDMSLLRHPNWFAAQDADLVALTRRRSRREPPGPTAYAITTGQLFCRPSALKLLIPWAEACEAMLKTKDLAHRGTPGPHVLDRADYNRGQEPKLWDMMQKHPVRMKEIPKWVIYKYHDWELRPPDVEPRSDAIIEHHFVHWDMNGRKNWRHGYDFGDTSCPTSPVSSRTSPGW